VALPNARSLVATNIILGPALELGEGSKPGFPLARGEGIGTVILDTIAEQQRAQGHVSREGVPIRKCPVEEQ
jgi:hypothetical protein